MSTRKIEMNRELAEKTALVVQQSSFVLDSYLHVLKNKLGEDEFKLYCKKFSKILTPAFTEVLKPLWDQYPDLLPEKMGGSYKTNDAHYKNIQDLVSKQINETNS